MKKNLSKFYSERGFVRSEVINTIPDVEHLSYLELGIAAGITFRAVRSKCKTSVDSSLKSRPTHRMTTDQFFEQNLTRYDIVFIDAWHMYQQVLKDFQSAVLICNKYIFLHDLFPPTADFAIPTLCADGYKLLYYLVKQQGITSIRTLNEDFGLTVVKMPLKTKLSPPLKDVDSLSYPDFRKWAKSYTRYPITEIVKFLQKVD